MKVAINKREEQKGLIRKRTEYHLSYRVELNDEERRLVNKTDLGKKVLYSYEAIDPKGTSFGSIGINIREACGPKGREHVFHSLDRVLAEEENIKRAFANLGNIFKAGAGGLGEGKEEVLEF
jgi:hypothetical protein